MSGALGHVNPDDLLRRYQQRAAEEIERRLPRGEPRRWLYEPLADYPGEPGRVCVPRCASPPAAPTEVWRTTPWPRQRRSS